MRKHLFVFTTALMLGVFVLATPMTAQRAAAAPNDAACWGQATKVFSQMGDMGKHASQEPTPRLGLKNLANALYAAGVIPDNTMQALGAFVANELGLSIAACMD
jgi:hypothetical protein